MNGKTLLLFALWLALLPRCRGEEVTNTFTLASGEILTIESREEWVGRDTSQHNRLYLVQPQAPRREYVGDIVSGGPRQPTWFLTDKPKIFRSGQRVVLVFGKYVFKRLEHNPGVIDMSGGRVRIRPPTKEEDVPIWHRFQTDPTPTAVLFLRSFLPLNDPRVDQDAKHVIGPKVPYTFDSIDLDHNILATRRDSAEDFFPKILVYYNQYYGDGWEFDVERTRTANNLHAPVETNILVDISVVTCPGNIIQFKDRDAALSAPNAKEVFTNAIQLSALEWRGGEYSVFLPTGSKRTERYKLLLGFPDLLPDRFHVLWQTPPLNPTWHFLKIGDWNVCDASRTKDNLTILVFFRVRKA